MKLEEYVTPEELRRLLASLVLFLFVLSVFVLFGFVVVPGLRNANSPRMPRVADSVALDSGWLDPAEQIPTRGYEIEPLDPEKVLKPATELLERGAALYEKSCQQCHGKDGRGDGPASAAIRPGPRNFKSPDGWKNGPDRAGIYKTLAKGIPGTSMAAYDNLLPRDRIALVHHVQTLVGFPRGPEPEDALKALEAELAGSGGKVPNKVPVSFAIARMEREAQRREPPPMPEPGPGPDGAVRRAVEDPARASRALAGTASWREGAGWLARLAVGGAPSNGFAIRASALGAEEWKAFLDRLITSFGPPGR